MSHMKNNEMRIKKEELCGGDIVVFRLKFEFIAFEKYILSEVQSVLINYKLILITNLHIFKIHNHLIIDFNVR